ncbi:MAG TPA: hypothetical protein VGD71_24010 [Kribbella sp.]
MSDSSNTWGEVHGLLFAAQSESKQYWVELVNTSRPTHAAWVRRTAACARNPGQPNGVAASPDLFPRSSGSQLGHPLIQGEIYTDLAG